MRAGAEGGDLGGGGVEGEGVVFGAEAYDLAVGPRTRNPAATTPSPTPTENGSTLLDNP